MQYRLHYTLSLSRQYRLQNTLKSPVKQDKTGYTTIIACPGNTDYNMAYALLLFAYNQPLWGGAGGPYGQSKTLAFAFGFSFTEIL